jgi:hypothetical protein
MDYKLILDLLQIVEKARLYPKLKLIHDTAMSELESIAQDPIGEDPPVPKAAAPIFPRNSGVMETPSSPNGLSLKPRVPEPGDA